MEAAPEVMEAAAEVMRTAATEPVAGMAAVGMGAVGMGAAATAAAADMGVRVAGGFKEKGAVVWMDGTAGRGVMARTAVAGVVTGTNTGQT